MFSMFMNKLSICLKSLENVHDKSLKASIMLKKNPYNYGLFYNYSRRITVLMKNSEIYAHL